MSGVIDLYCERGADGLLAEPLNAVTNLAFLVAAGCAWRRLATTPAPGGMSLVVLLGAIGIGSGLFHTFARAWAQWLDVIPILLFQLCFIALYCRRAIGLGAAASAAAVVVFAAALIAAGLAGPALNGSLGYAPALLVLFGLGAWHWNHAPRERAVVVAAAGVFALSLTLRTIDLAVCSAFPTGTHFAWHLLNALVLYLVTRGYMDVAGDVAGDMAGAGVDRGRTVK